MTDPTTKTETEQQNKAIKPAGKAKKESLLLNLLVNIIIPTLVLTKLSGDDYLGTKGALIAALSFPLAYGLRYFLQERKLNAFSALGTISILLTGGISLLELDAKYIAIKEAAIPGIIGLATLISMKTSYPLVKTFLYNDKVLKVDLIAERLAHFQNKQAFNKALNNASLMVAGSFFLSSVLNYILAKVLLVSPPGTAAFNEELGKMTALSFPVIALPATLVLMIALFYLFRRIHQLTELGLEDVVNTEI